MNREPSSPPRYHHKRRNVEGLDLKTFFKPALYLVLLLGSYIIVYVAASSSKPKPANLTSRIVQNAVALATSEPTYYFSTQCADPVTPELVRETILDRAFNGTSPWEYFPPPHVSSYLVRKKVKGWGSYGAVFENLIRKVQPKTIIEIGTFLGASTLHMVDLTRRFGLETHILCVDDFRAWPSFRKIVKDIPMLNGDLVLLHQFMQNVIDANATESISFMPFSSETVLEAFCEWGIFADLVEVDAAHYFHSAWTDINRGYKLLRPGGIIFGHDYFLGDDNRGVKRAVDLFARLNNLKVQVDGEHWVLTPY